MASLLQCREWTISLSVRLWLLWLREDRQEQTRALESTYWLFPRWTPQLDSEDRPTLLPRMGLCGLAVGSVALMGLVLRI